MHIRDYYFHTISKDNVENIYIDFENILKDGKLKSQKYLNNNKLKFNGLDYISFASFVEMSLYKTFVIDELNYKKSKLSDLFISYEEYLKYLSLNEWLENPISKEEFFSINNTINKKDYYNYLDSISRTYPVDIMYLYKMTNNLVYKNILDIIDGNILYCNKSEYCFETYIRNSKGITFVFPKNIDVKDTFIIPNLPMNIEDKLVEKICSLSNRYSNQIGEVQVKDYIDIKKSMGILINEFIDREYVKLLLKRYNFNLKLYKLSNDFLVEL